MNLNKSKEKSLGLKVSWLDLTGLFLHDTIKKGDKASPFKICKYRL